MTSKTTTAKKTPATKTPANRRPASTRPGRKSGNPVQDREASAKAAKAPARKTTAPAAKAPAKVSTKDRKVTAGGLTHPGVEWKALLASSGLNQTQLKEKTGVNGPTMNAVLNQRAIPTAAITVRFAKALNLDAKKLWATVSAYALAEALAASK